MVRRYATQIGIGCKFKDGWHAPRREPQKICNAATSIPGMALGVSAALQMLMGCETRHGVAQAAPHCVNDAEVLRHIRNAEGHAAIGFLESVALLRQICDGTRPALITPPPVAP